MFQTKFVEKTKTHLMFNKVFSPSKIVFLWENAEKYSIIRQAAGNNMEHAHCMLDN